MPDLATEPSTPPRSTGRRIVAVVVALAVTLATIGTVWAAAQRISADPGPEPGSRQPIPVRTDLPEPGDPLGGGQSVPADPTEPPASDISEP